MRKPFTMERQNSQLAAHPLSGTQPRQTSRGHQYTTRHQTLENRPDATECLTVTDRELLSEHGVVASRSAKGNCYDNAAMESWNHSLKVEAIHGERFTSREQAKAHVFEYIEVDYNRSRMHSTLGYLSPEQFERSHAA
jgi:transposase InsO family protein